MKHWPNSTDYSAVLSRSSFASVHIKGRKTERERKIHTKTLWSSIIIV